MILRTLAEKCKFKGIDVPTIEILSNRPERKDLEVDWEHMLAHQLPMLPLFAQFWDDLADVFAWLHRTKEKEVYATVPEMGAAIDYSWTPPPMAQAWHQEVPLEVIRFAASNRLCVDLLYNNQTRLIEPYSLRRTQDGDILLHAVRHEDGQHRSYRIDRIQGATATNVSFTARYAVELTASGPIHAPATERLSRARSSSSVYGRRKSHSGPTYVIECSYCGKKFRRKTRDTSMRPHKDKDGYRCSGRRGYLVDTIY